MGGFFSEEEVETQNKVPLLGDIPVIKFFFSSKSNQKEQSSLMFVVTPHSYSPENHASNNRMSQALDEKLKVTPKEGTWDDPRNNDLEKANLPRTLDNIKKESGLFPKQKTSTGSRRR